MIDGIGAFYLSQINFDRCAHTTPAMQTPCTNNPACAELMYPSQTCYCCDVLENERACSVPLLSGRPHYFSGVKSCGSIPGTLYSILVVLVIFHIISGIFSVIAIQVFGLLMGTTQINDANDTVTDTVVATQVMQDDDKAEILQLVATLSNNNETPPPGGESRNTEGVNPPIPFDAAHKKSESQTIELPAEGEFKNLEETQNSKKSINKTMPFDSSCDALNEESTDRSTSLEQELKGDDVSEEPVKVIKVSPVDKSQLATTDSGILHPTHDIIELESMEVNTPATESAHYQTDTANVESAQTTESKTKSDFKKSNTFDTGLDVAPKPAVRSKGMSIDVLPGSTNKTDESEKELTNSKSEERIIIKKGTQRTHSVI